MVLLTKQLKGEFMRRAAHFSYRNLIPTTTYQLKLDPYYSWSWILVLACIMRKTNAKFLSGGV